MRHTEAIKTLGGVLGINTDALTPTEVTSLERSFDEVFEQGYQAGIKDKAMDAARVQVSDL